MRIRLERDVANMKDQPQGIIYQICSNFLDIPLRDSMRPFTVLWMPMRIAGWFVWIPIKLGSLSISTYAYLMGKVLRASRDVLGGENFILAAEQKRKEGYSLVKGDESHV